MLHCFCCFFNGSVYRFFFGRLYGRFQNIFCAHQEVSSVRKIMQTVVNTYDFCEFFHFTSIFRQFFFCCFSFVSSFEHIIPKRSHLRNENIYRSFSIKNAILCGRCFTKGKLFTFSVYLGPVVPSLELGIGGKRPTLNLLFIIWGLVHVKTK